MKRLVAIIALLLFILQANSQSFPQEGLLNTTPAQKRCATFEVLQGFRNLHPGAETDQQFEAWLAQKIRERADLRPDGTEAVVTLPVIFHIIHNSEAVGTGSNLSAAAIQQQVMQLNKDYANLSHSIYGVAADMEIQFALAQKDPGGTNLAEPGIDRIDRAVAGFIAPPYTVGFAVPANNYLTNTIKPATIWDPSKYINVWVLQMEASILGIATFPNSSGLPGIGVTNESATTSGIAVAPFSIGSVFAPNGGCSGTFGRGKTLSHEMGHFFGLRHIWGDATCGNDFCGDTPVHEDANSGVPVHPKANSCGTVDEMFENYMDYSDDIVLNTFTADQKTRMQAVLTNSPFRNTLATSTAGLVAVTGNRISFFDCTGVATFSETGTTGTYPRFRDVSFVLNVENKATAAATLTINPGGTAVNGFHYQVMTPSLVFATGDDSKTLTVRLFDNAQVDGSRTLTLGYSITGTGITAGPSAQTMTVTITDDDNITISNTPITVLSQNFDVSLAGWSLLSTAGMPNLWRVSAAGDAGGTGNAAFISETPSPGPFANTYDENTAGTAVLRSPLINANGITNMQLTFKYKVWGENDGITAFDFGLMTYATSAAPTSFITVPAANTGPYSGTAGIDAGTPVINFPNATFSNTSFHLGFLWQNDDNTGDDPAWNIDDVVLTGTGTTIETAVSNSFGYDVRSGSTTNHFRSTNNKIIADVNNANAALTGITVSITQAGTGTNAITTPAGSFMRTNKVIQITPATPNTTATYQATLYFTTAELAVWGVGNIPNLKILKVKDGTSLAASLNTSNSTVITPTFSDQSATGGYYAYTANFTGGFSQFILVSPTTTLPVDLISFEAKPVRKTIVLNWSTAQELNNKGFAIERSNGGSFEKIGWVDGKINSSIRSDYTYTDNYVQPGITYSYRLRQTDIDGREKLSVIRQAKIDNAGLALTINPNPAKDQLSLFIFGSSARANVSLVNMQGQVVRKWDQVNASTAPLPLDIRGLASGLYLLQVAIPGDGISEKIMIK